MVCCVCATIEEKALIRITYRTDSSWQSKHGKQECRWLDPNCMTPFLPFGPLPLIVFILLLQILFHHFEEKQQIATRASLRPVFNVVRRPAQRGLRCAERDWIRPLMLTGPDTNNAAFHSPHPVVINLLKTFSTTCFFRLLSTAARKGPEGCRVDHEQERERERQFQWTFLIFCPLELPQKRHLTQQHKAVTLSQCADVNPLDSFSKTVCGWNVTKKNPKRDKGETKVASLCI